MKTEQQLIGFRDQAQALMDKGLIGAQEFINFIDWVLE
jgi:hypothetical protein